MELPLAALGCKLSGYVPEVPPGQMQRRGAATHGQTCFAPNWYTIFWRPPLAQVRQQNSKTGEALPEQAQSCLAQG